MTLADIIKALTNVFHCRAGGGKKIAEQSYKVNSGPSRGRCYVSPLTGVEMTTVFTVHCEGWTGQDVSTSFYFEVQSQYDQPLLLYSGHNNTINFCLAAHSQPGNYSVCFQIVLFFFVPFTCSLLSLVIIEFGIQLNLSSIVFSEFPLRS